MRDFDRALFAVYLGVWQCAGWEASNCQRWEMWVHGCFRHGRHIVFDHAKLIVA